jgi:hypothetical protein
MTALLSTGLLAQVAAGSLAGMTAGQYGRLSGVGGAAAAASLAVLTVSSVGLVGMGLQGVGLGLSGLGASSSLATQLFMAGTSTAGWSASAAVWLAGVKIPGPQTLPNQGRVTNPGRLGGQAHQAGIATIEKQIKKQGYIPKTEYRVLTQGGTKPYRYVDVAALDVNNRPVAFYQVGRSTAGNIPIIRERRAIFDVYEFGGYDVPIIFIPYW